MSEHARQLAQKLRDDLQSPFGSLQDLCGVLVAPLLAFGLTRSGIPEQYKLQENPWLELDAQDKAYILKVYWAQFQEILATKIVIDWLDHLREDNLDKDLWLPFFCPSKTSFYFVSVIRISLSTLPTILVNKSVTAKLSSTAQKAAPLPEFVKQTSIQSLAQVAQAVTLCDIFTDTFRSQNQEGALLDWQAFFDRYVALPSRVANAIGDTGDTPQALEWRVFYISLSRQFETLVYVTSNSQGSATARDALVYGLGKIARSGFMNHEQGRTTFWSAIMPVLRRHLLAKTCSKDLIEIWQQMVASLSTTDYRTCVSSLMASMSESLNAADDARSVRRASVMMSRILGPVTTDNERLWSTTIKGVFLSKFWSPPVARTLSLWAAGDNGNAVSVQTRLLQATLELWSEKEVIERAPISYHTYLTSVVLLTLQKMPSFDKAIIDMSRTPMFLTAVTTHLSTMRDIVRLQGMLVAEEVSKKSLNSEGPVKPLDFGDIWEAEGPSYDSIRELKAWLCEAAEDIKVVDWMLDDTEVGQVEEVDDFKPAVGAFHTLDAPTTQTKISESAIPSAPKPGGKGLIQVIDSTSEFDDYEEVDEPDLQPYALPPKPAAEDLKDIDDLSAYTPAKKKAKPPVYIPDLCAYLRSDNADKLAVGLKEAASLIRRKAQWGTELTDAAVELAYILSGLQDNYNIDHFEERRREALTALTAMAPDKAAPAVIEQFFTNQYSIHQRTTMLVSLALGARELAGEAPLPFAITGPPSEKDHFLSQRLPDKLHERFISNKSDADSTGRELQLLTEDITNIALARTRDSAEGSMPQAQKEKLLTVRSTRQKVAPTSRTAAASTTQSKTRAYNDLAVSTFIMPLLNRFWLYLRDVSTSPQNFRVGVFKGGSAGTVTLLEPLLLSKFLSTMTVLLESARNSPHFLAVIAPETLELVLAIRGINPEDTTVQTSMLQLALVVLDGSTSIDAGRTLAREHSKALWQLKDWAEEVWTKHEGERVDAEGRAAAGVLLRIDGVVQKTIGYV